MPPFHLQWLHVEGPWWQLQWNTELAGGVSGTTQETHFLVLQWFLVVGWHGFSLFCFVIFWWMSGWKCWFDGIKLCCLFPATAGWKYISLTSAYSRYQVYVLSLFRGAKCYFCAAKCSQSHKKIHEVTTQPQISGCSWNFFPRTLPVVSFWNASSRNPGKKTHGSQRQWATKSRKIVWSFKLSNFVESTFT